MTEMISRWDINKHYEVGDKVIRPTLSYYGRDDNFLVKGVKIIGKALGLNKGRYVDTVFRCVKKW